MKLLRMSKIGVQVKHPANAVSDSVEMYFLRQHNDPVLSRVSWSWSNLTGEKLTIIFCRKRDRNLLWTSSGGRTA